MGLGKFWLAATTLAAVTSVHTPMPNAGTEPAGYVQLVHPIETSRSSALASAGLSRVWTETGRPDEPSGTTLPGRSLRFVSPLTEPPFPLFEFVDTGDEYGTVLVRRVDPRNVVEDLEPAPAEDHAQPSGEATPQARAIEDIRALTGLSWPRIAQLVGVERQTIYRWRSGEPADEQKLQRASEVLDVLNEAQEEHGTGDDLRAWLNRVAPLQAASPYQLLSQGRYDEARFLAMLAPSRVTSISDLARDTSRWDRHFAEEERSYRD